MEKVRGDLWKLEKGQGRCCLVTLLKILLKMQLKILIMMLIQMKTKKADNDNERKKVTKQGNTQRQSYVHGNTQPQPLLGFYLLRLL